MKCHKVLLGIKDRALGETKLKAAHCNVESLSDFFSLCSTNALGSAKKYDDKMCEVISKI